MTIITFYEKPGCGNNTKQKVLLAAAGHQVIPRDLLAEPWTKQRLLEFSEIARWRSGLIAQLRASNSARSFPNG